MMRVEELLKELVRIDSVSARSNAEIISRLNVHAVEAGLTVRHLPYRDERGIEKVNMIALAAAEGASTTEHEVELALVGHTDTVPYDPNWLEATELTARDGRLYGRGACDTKAFIAAALTALESIDKSRLKRPLALIFTADEEVGCLGAKRLEAESGLRIRYSIVGEPTSLRPIRAGKGYCLAEIVVRGIEGHSAYPAVGASAIFRGARLVSRIEKIAEALKEEGHADFEPPYTTLNVGLINGGTAKNIIPGQCRFTLEWRPVPGQAVERVLDLLRVAVEDEKRLDAGFDCEVIPVRLDTGMETRADSTLVRLLEEASGREAGTIAFGTEAPQMINLGAEAVVFGPGDIRVAHRTGEFVPVEELHACVLILKRAIEHFCL